ncbi:DUF1998 domain-containing protein [candidate division KSB1 bacterium]|nr:MAG: DUF1998 domain-containing protein [candidate division KSB1 bacterium]
MKTKLGDIRPSQLLYTYGVGSLLDLPNFSVLVMGLDDWDISYARVISEERLLQAVRQQLGSQIEALRHPPYDSKDDEKGFNQYNTVTAGVPVVPFPRWARCPQCSLLAPISSGLFEIQKQPFYPDRTRVVHTHCEKADRPPPVIPVRFLLACSNGHLDDFPWVEYVHKGPCNCRPIILKMFEFGVSGEASDIIVRCETCKEERRMGDAFGADAPKHLPKCRGWHPHIKRTDDKECEESVKTILLGASNSWFPVTLSALSIPQSTDRLSQLVDKNWSVLAEAVTIDVLRAFRKVGNLPDFAGYKDEEIFVRIEARRSEKPVGTSEDGKDLKLPEWSVLSGLKVISNTSDFSLRTVDVPKHFREIIARVVLVERLREVRSLIGFTRVESPGEFDEFMEISNADYSPLSRKPPVWIPTTEVFGEGLFIQFEESAIQSWRKRTPVAKREHEFFEAHKAWRFAHKLTPVEQGFRGLRYVLLHSFAHAVLRQLATDSGYAAASVRERIYSREVDLPGGPMAGLLLYTAAPDSEGTLGGLVSLGDPEKLSYHVLQALERARLCASDPLCSEHKPYDEHATLHGAACHGCLFSPETSCEHGNKYLDRSTLVKTFAVEDVAFFVSN